MAYTANVPGSVDFSKIDFGDVTGSGLYSASSCYSYLEKLLQLNNPLSFSYDAVFPVAKASASKHSEDQGQEESESPGSVGCLGNLIDNEFPLEARTPCVLPLLMYPTVTNGKRLHEVDMCALPVLNWEGYILDIKSSLSVCHFSQKSAKPSSSTQRDFVLKEQATNPETHGRTSPFPEMDANQLHNGQCDETLLNIQKPKPGSKKRKKSTKNNFLNILLEEKDSAQAQEMKERPQKFTAHNMDTIGSNRSTDKFKMPLQCLHRLKNQPALKVQGTWNNLFGGLGGACCFMKTGASSKVSRKLRVFVGKGSRLRAVDLAETGGSSILSYKTECVWEESEEDFQSDKRHSDGPLDNLILQVVPSDRHDILGVRRGKRIDVYSTEEDIPYCLESIPNVFYGTKVYGPSQSKSMDYIRDPLLLGLDLNTNYSPEILTIDENRVVRVCDISTRTTESLYALPRASTEYRRRPTPPGYPSFTINDAAGVSFTNFPKLFYAWGNSIVHLGDRRDKKLSRCHLMPIFNLRHHVHSHALSDQNFFHEKQTELNDYISCVKKSNRENYYYVGTTSKVYLMDFRAPNLPVLMVNHGLQSPLTYITTVNDDNFEILVGASQRLTETVCLITDGAHIQCIGRNGCEAKNPVLHCYPKHLSNSREYFEAAVKEGFEFPMPFDHDVLRSHHYAWTTGLGVLPLTSKVNPKLPFGILVATSNNFGDVFVQEWNQKPLASHRTINFGDYKLRSFLSSWKKSMQLQTSLDDTPTPSNNRWQPTDCSLIVEPVAREIKKLTIVRDSPFNCFLPDQLQYTQELDKMKSMDSLMTKLKKYKGQRAKSILDAWNFQEEENPVILAEVKEEPLEYGELYLSSPRLSVHTIDLEQSDLEQLDHGVTQLSETQKNCANSASLPVPNFEMNPPERPICTPLETSLNTISDNATEMEYVQTRETTDENEHDIFSDNFNEDEHNQSMNVTEFPFSQVTNSPSYTLFPDSFEDDRYQSIPSSSQRQSTSFKKLSRNKRSGFL